MAAWESWLPVQKRRLSLQQGQVWLTQHPQRDATALIQALQKEYHFSNPKTSQSRALSNSIIDTFTGGCSEESANLQPLISFSEEHIDVPTDTSFLWQAFHAHESEDLIASSETGSPVVGMESAFESIHDSSSAPSDGLLLSKSPGRWSSLTNNVNFQSSLGKHTLNNNNRTVMGSTSPASRPEFLDSDRVTLAAPGAPPSSNVVALVDAPSSVRAGGKRLSKKRTRASRGPPTTILEADSSNFRAMVQQLTGMVPSSPNFLSSSLQHSRLEQLSSHHGLVRPQPTRPAAFAAGQSSVPRLARLHREWLRTADPTSLHGSQASTYRESPKSHEVAPSTFVSKQLGLDHQPNSAMDFSKISEESRSHLNPSSVFQPLGYLDMAPLLSARDHSPSHMLADEFQFWDSKVDQSLRNINFDDLSSVKLVSPSKNMDCSENQFHDKATIDRHATSLDISSTDRSSGNIVDSWLSQAD
ncbi:hypothetical protein O6H91_15G081500 [Diphasiastrum complanatum]|uniref:Uncharacterized protein n=1 Tax=Diphasiastrum complanatum TaxID=34168 RepID=A0ACC2BK88_DIPCM|nr:hypothetical protein O6H91_15G081500 [Diphasiastrum complanatum]